MLRILHISFHDLYKLTRHINQQKKKKIYLSFLMILEFINNIYFQIIFYILCYKICNMFNIFQKERVISLGRLEFLVGVIIRCLRLVYKLVFFFLLFSFYILFFKISFFYKFSHFLKYK